MTAPTLVASYLASTVWTNSTSPKDTAAFGTSRAIGDVLVCIVLCEDTSSPAIAPVNENGLTWSLLRNVVTADRCEAWVYTAVASTASNVRVRVQEASATSLHWGARVFHYTGSAGVGVHNMGNGADSAPNVTLTGVAADSAIVMGIADWEAGSVAGTTYRTADAGTFTQTDAVQGTNLSVWCGHHANAGAAGNKAVGFTAPSAPDWSLVAVEVLGAAGGTTHEGDAAVSAVGTVTATAVAQRSATASVNPSASITASAALSASVTAATTVGVGVSAAGVRAAQGTATRAAQVDVSASAQRVAPMGAAVAVGVAVTADAVVESSESAEATVPVSVAVTAGARLAAAGAVSVAPVATISAVGQRAAVEDSTLTVGVGISAAAVVVRSSSAAVAPVVLVDADAALVARSPAAVAVGVGIVAEASVATEWAPSVDVSFAIGATRERSSAAVVPAVVYRDRVTAGETRRGTTVNPATRRGSVSAGDTREERHA
jgi:hypothetical protein